MSYLLYLIGGSLETLLVFSNSLLLLDYKFRIRDFWTLLLLSMIISIFILLFKGILPSAIYTLALLIVVSICIYKVFLIPLKYASLSVVVSSIILFLSTILNYKIIIEIFSVEISEDALLISFICMFANFVSIALLFIVLKKLNFKIGSFWRDYDSKDRKRVYTLLAIFTLVLYLLSIITVYNYRNIISSISILNIYFTVIFGVILTSIICLAVYYERQNTLRELEIQNYKNGDEYMRLLKSQRHDMIFHLSSIQSMLSLKQYDALNKYLSKITNHVTSINSTLFMHSPAVSALLYSFQQKARNEDVSFDLTIKDDLKELPISEYDFNIIIGNLLQNAFEHVKNLDRKMRNISMTAESDVNHFFISISNTGIIDHLVLNKMFDVGFTTKKEENTRRGYGLFSVKKVVEQNNGIIYPEIMDHTITFNVVFDRAI